MTTREFPDCLVVRIPGCHCCDPGSSESQNWKNHTTDSDPSLLPIWQACPALGALLAPPVTIKLVVAPTLQMSKLRLEEVAFLRVTQLLRWQGWVVEVEDT